MKQAIVTLFTLAFVIVPITSKICEHDPLLGLWRATDRPFALAYNFDSIVHEVNFDVHNLLNEVLHHKQELDIVQKWCGTAAAGYSDATYMLVQSLADYAYQKGFIKGLKIIQGFYTFTQEGAANVQQLANILYNSVSEYKIKFDEEIKQYREEFNNRTEESFNGIGEIVSKIDEPNKLCVNKALRSVANIIETHHPGMKNCLKEEITKDGSIFKFHEELEKLPEQFNTILIEPSMKCIDDALFNHIGDEVDEIAEQCIQKIKSICLV